VLARSFHVRKNNERVLNARSVRNEQNVPNVRSNYDNNNNCQIFSEWALIEMISFNVQRGSYKLNILTL